MSKLKRSYKELVTAAEAAVVDIKDAELRRAAFEKVLDDMLGASAPSKGTPAAHSDGKERKTRAKRTSKGPRGYVRELVDEGFFKKQKTIADVRTELANRGHHLPLNNLSGPLQLMCKERKLRRQKTKIKGNKQTYAYSNW